MTSMQRKSLLSAAALCAALGCATAQAGGHYVPGVEGLQAASAPPPGNYYLGYLVNYSIGSLRAPGTDSDIPGHNTGTVTALANRLVKITSHKVLGADYGFETIIPVMRTSLTFNAAGISDSRSGVGDVYVGPLVLGWHGERWDAVAAAGMWLDVGDDDHPASPGQGYKSTMLTAGATYYLDAAKTISASALSRFERNGKKDGFRPGNQLSLEWGIGKSFGTWQAGIVGYDQWQLTEDSGTGASQDKYSRHAVGAEAVYPVPGAGLFLKGAVYKEYRAEAGTAPQSKGSLVRVSLVKAF